jgi:hypothetical protein
MRPRTHASELQQERHLMVQGSAQDEQKSAALLSRLAPTHVAGEQIGVDAPQLSTRGLQLRSLPAHGQYLIG